MFNLREQDTAAIDADALGLSDGRTERLMNRGEISPRVPFGPT
jgi:hypothetical protein